MMFKTVLGAAAAATLASALAPTMASAQAYGAYGNGAYASGATYDGGYYYDPCKRSTTQRGTGGGLVGAGLGAAIGSGVAAKGARTEGAVLGGLLGAIAGSAIGRNSAACTSTASAPPPPPPPPPAYDQGAQNDRNRPFDEPSYQDSRYGDRRDGYTYESERSYSVAGSKDDANGCTLAESPIYLPDGRVQKRFVRVCPDAQGRYQVVD